MHFLIRSFSIHWTNLLFLHLHFYKNSAIASILLKAFSFVKNIWKVMTELKLLFGKVPFLHYSISKMHYSCSILMVIFDLETLFIYSMNTLFCVIKSVESFYLYFRNFQDYSNLCNYLSKVLLKQYFCISVISVRY